MQRIHFYQNLSNQPVKCTICKKQSPYYLHLIINQNKNKKSHCYQCIKNNQQLLKNVSLPYKQYFQQLFQNVPLPDIQFAQQCVKSLQDMRNDSIKIVKDLNKAITEFEKDIIDFYTEAKIICQGYIEKIKSFSEKSFQDVIKSSTTTFINQEKYIRNIKSKYKISCKIKQTLEQLKIKIPSIKQIAINQQNQVKRHSICQVPIHSTISIKQKLYFGTADGKIIYEQKDLWKSIQAHQSLIRSLAYDGQYTLYSGSDDFKIKAWDLRKKNQIKFIAEFGIIPNLKSYHRDIIVFNKGKTMASTRGQFDSFKIRLWQLKNYKNVKQLEGHQNYIRGMSMNRKQQLITVSDDRSLKVWNLNIGKCDRVFYHNKKIQSVHCNKQKDLICIYDEDNRIMILNDQRLNIIQCWPMNKKILCSEGKNLLYFGLNNQIVIHNWFGTRLYTHVLDNQFVPGIMQELDHKLIVCDGKGKCLQIPISEQKFISNQL